MAEIDHNAPQFHYRYFNQGKHFIDNQPKFKRYKIRVQAVNEKGESNVAVKEVDGYSS